MLCTLARLATVAFACGFAAQPATADCSGIRLTIARGAYNYVCRANCAALPDASLALSEDYRGHDATMCMAICDARTDCRAISFEFIFVGDTPMTRCYIYREGDLTTYDRIADPSPRARQPGVCYRQWVPGRDPRVKIDTDVFHQDQFRPGLPGVPGPKK